MKIYQSEEITIEEKRLLLSYVFSNSSMNVGIIKGNYTFAFEFLAEWIPKLNTNFELGKIRSINGEKDAYASLRSVLCQLVDTFKNLNYADLIREIDSLGSLLAPARLELAKTPLNRAGLS